MIANSKPPTARRPLQSSAGVLTRLCGDALPATPLSFCRRRPPGCQHTEMVAAGKRIDAVRRQLSHPAPGSATGLTSLGRRIRRRPVASRCFPHTWSAPNVGAGLPDGAGTQCVVDCSDANSSITSHRCVRAQQRHHLAWSSRSGIAVAGQRSTGGSHLSRLFARPAAIASIRESGALTGSAGCAPASASVSRTPIPCTFR